jgi:salicylate hydroxylase
MRDLKIAIIGAGIAGLTAARALQTFGFRPQVFEQSLELGEVGAGLTISSNATHVLNTIGLADVLPVIGLRPDQGGVKHWSTGETMIEIMRGDEMLQRYGAAYYQVHRADLHDALAAQVRAADPDAIHLGQRFRSMAAQGGKNSLTFDSGAAVVADVVIGADGSRSVVRRALFGALVPRAALPTEAERPSLLRPTSCISIGPGHTFARYLIRGGNTVNFVGLAERDDWREEGWSIRSSIDELAREFAGWYEDLQIIIRAAPPDQLFKWALFDRDPLPTWTRGSATLIGDAAHPMLPFLGQGAAMGIEDGMVIARAFAESDSIASALARYESARHERTTFVLQKSRETGRSYHAANPDTYRGTHHLSAESLGLMSYNATTVPI